MTRFFSSCFGCALLTLACPFFAPTSAQQIPPKSFAVLASATVQESGTGAPRIVLTWPADAAATNYTISRRTLDQGWQPIATLTGGATSFSDGNVLIGTKYEYQFIKQTSAGYTGYGYISAGIRVPVPRYFGKLILVVENYLALPLASELARLEEDIRGDGWDVVRLNVPMSESPPSVKSRIKAIYDSDPGNVQAVLLLGHVAVPYSGDIMPDGHPNHQGAWPADVYYGDMDGPWTDYLVNTTTAERTDNHNIPGDGKLDQSQIPSEVELWVGRVDLHNMTCYANKPAARSELDLMRQYLNKNHAFRHGRVPVQRRGLICDNFSDKGDDPIGGSAWRNFAPFFGAANITEVAWDGYFPAATSGSYLWSFASGGGSYYYSSGVGTSDDFALQNVRVVFAMFMGSYFGDWNNESNFLRASLGSGDVLAASYSGFPHSLYFPMGLGEPIGYGTWLSQNNHTNGLYPPWTQGTSQVHISLHGDPTLRMHPVIPPSNVTAAESNGILVSWSASSDSAIQGYEVYRANDASASFSKISGTTLVQGTSFHDPAGTTSHAYAIRAVKLEQSGSGTYLNPSQRVLARPGGPAPTAPNAPSNLSGAALSSTQIRLTWSDNSSNETGFRILRKAGSTGTYTSFTVGANVTAHTDASLVAGTQYFYKVHAYNSVGNSADTAEISVSTPPPPVRTNSANFVRLDTTTSGSWKTAYGYDGAFAPFSDFVAPAYVQINAYLNYSFTWENPSTRPAALEKRTSTARFATRWQYTNTFYFYLQFKDTAVHRVSFYFLDFENLGREQKVEFFDYTTGEFLGATTVANFQNGLYSTWDLKGKITVKFTALGAGGAVLSGIFFDPQTRPATSASFVSNDTTTSGSWKSVYGGEGAFAPYSDFIAPTYVQINAYLNYPLTWENPSTRPAALEKRTSTARFATCWQHSAPFFFYLQFKDSADHRVSFYFHDFEALGRRQAVEFFDYVSGARLGGTTIENFQNGLYSTWNLKGRITMKITPLGSGSAVMSGILFDTASPNAVRFLGANSTTSGNWKGLFGAQGVQIAGDASQLPPNATVHLTGKSDHVWNDNPAQAAALQRFSSTARVAACWYAAESFEVSVNITDGSTRKISFYSLDWDMQNRTQRIEVLSAATGALLHTVNLSAFQNGIYHSYDLKGSVRFRFVRTGPLNAVVSALFFDPPSAPL